MENGETNVNGPGKVAFLGYLELDNGASYRGAILVTDDWGKPLEFRCTAPVKPTAVQRTLYGSTLMPHVLVALIGKPLIDALNEEPVAVLVSESMFLDLRHNARRSHVRAFFRGWDDSYLIRSDRQHGMGSIGRAC